VYPFIPIAKTSGSTVQIRLESIQLDLKRSAIPDYQTGVDKDLNRARLIFDTAFGAGKHRRAYDFDVRLKNGDAMINHVFNAGGAEVYRGPWRLGVPFVMSMAVINDRAELDALKGVISEGGKFAKTIAGEGEGDLISATTKALESIRSHIMEFLPKKVSVGKLSGIIADAGSLTRELFELPNFAAPKGSLKTWNKVRFTLASERAGSAVITLGVKSV